MLQVNNVSLRFDKKVLFEDVNLKFTSGNCYGIIGANGAGKSTFLKLLTGEIDTTTGSISVSSDERISILKQDHYEYDDMRVLDVVIMGNDRLYKIMKEKEDFIYSIMFDSYYFGMEEILMDSVQSYSMKELLNKTVNALLGCHDLALSC